MVENIAPTHVRCCVAWAFHTGSNLLLRCTLGFLTSCNSCNSCNLFNSFNLLTRSSPTGGLSPRRLNGSGLFQNELVPVADYFAAIAVAVLAVPDREGDLGRPLHGEGHVVRFARLNRADEHDVPM